MRMTPVSSRLLVVVCVAIASCAAVRPVSELSTLVDRINRTALHSPTHRIQVAKIEQEMKQSGLDEFSGAQLRSWSSADLRDAMAAYDGAIYLSNAALAARWVPTMERIVDELVQRGEDIAPVVRSLHKSLILARDFDRARQLAARYPEVSDLSEIPNTTSEIHVWRAHLGDTEPAASGVRTRWQTTADGALSRRSVSVPSGIAVVGIVGPSCHFSARAMKAIRGDAELESLLREAIWLMPPAQSLEAAEVRAWNHANPSYRFDYVHRVREWPEIERWDTPQFHVYANGKVVATVAGWPREGRKEEMRAAFAKARAAIAEK